MKSILLPASLLISGVATVFLALNLDDPNYGDVYSLGASILALVDICLYCKLNPINKNQDIKD